MSDIADRIEVHPIPTIDSLAAETLAAARLTVVEMCPNDAKTMLSRLGLAPFDAETVQ
jgi:hypothetical protein